MNWLSQGLDDITAAFQNRDFGAAKQSVDALIARMGNDPDLLLIRAECEVGVADPEAAIKSLRLYLDQRPDDEFNRLRLISLLHSGEGYQEVLARIHRTVDTGFYLEIGVADGDSLTVVPEGCEIIGVDPDPKVDFDRDQMTIYPVTSDAFFASEEACGRLRNRTLDLAFIDGLHTFEQTLLDVVNLSRYCGPETVVLLHDCYPIDATSAMQERTTSIWSGDVWKVIIALLSVMPRDDVRVIKTGPTGLGVITGVDAYSGFLAERYDALVEQFAPTEFAWLAEDMDSRLNALTNTPQSIDRIFRQSASV